VLRAGLREATSNTSSWDTLRISYDQIRETLEGAQRERGTDLTIFSLRANSMARHVGGAQTSRVWSEICNELVHRCCTLYPRNLVEVCRLPPSAGRAPSTCIPWSHPVGAPHSGRRFRALNLWH